MKSIMCYGDSLTWGYIPVTGQRYPESVRWTAVMKDALGDGYNVIEEGLSGRTTVFDVYYDKELNGERHLEAELRSHAPLALVILMLGTNDLELGHGAWEASRGIRKLGGIILSRSDCFVQKRPRLLLVAPPHLGEAIKRDPSPISLRGYEEAKKFAPLYRMAAEKLGCDFLDAGRITQPSALDAEHLTEEGNLLLAQAMTKKVKEILEDEQRA